MASGSESAAEKVEPVWEVCPTEDVVQALMEALVDPLLPLRVSSVPPSEDVQIAVAKQMHAVVLLYNYHHRKLKPELEFLEFVNFCKLAIVIRPHLIAFMKMMKESKLMELNGAEDCLSVTEKAIKDACDISLGLDASKDVPNMEGWTVSKVVVLLIDSKKENFMLQFVDVTKGAWSLIEKELSESSITPEISAGDKVGNKRTRDNLKVSTYNTEFLQLGYDAVKDVTGISSSHLEVLETHMAYSLIKEKSAACFYIMQYPGSFNDNEQAPLKFVVESVQGPLAEKFADGSWKATPLVNYHHMLPYVDFILCWLSGCETKVNSSYKNASENRYSNNKCDYSSCEQVGSPVDIFQSTEKDGNLTNKFVKSFDILNSAESSRNGILENLADESEQPDEGLSCSPSRGLCKMMVDVDNTEEEFEKGCGLADPATEVENSDTESDVPISGHVRRLFGEKVVDDNVREKFNEKLDVGHSAEKDERSICPEILDEDRVACGKNILFVPPRMLKRTNMDHLTDICTDSEDSKGLNSNIKVYCHRSKKKSSLKNPAQLPEAVQDLKVDMEDSLESNHTLRTDEKISGDKGYLPNTCKQAGTASTGDQRAQIEAKIKHNIEVQSTSDSIFSDHIRSRDETVSGDKGNHTQECNRTGIVATGNQLAQVEAEFNRDLGAQTLSASDQQAQHKVNIKHNIEVHSKSDSFVPDHIQSGDEANHIRECNRTGIAATENQLAQVEAKFDHDLGVKTLSVPDQLQNALALLYRKRRELYSQICNMEDTLALCEDNVARIRDGGEVDLARRCIKSVISGNFHSLLENGTQVQDTGNQLDDNNCKSQHGKSPILSETYLPGNSPCQDLEYTCLRNNWRLPRYITESSDGKFQSNAVVEGKDFKLHAKGGFESNPCKARETAAAEMITVMKKTFL